MSWGSTYPAACAALALRFAQAPAFAGVEIRNGPQLTNTEAPEVVTVAFTSVEDDSTADGEWSQEGLGTVPDREQYTIACAASVLNGDGDVTAARNRVFVLTSAAGQVIAADSELGGIVMSAGMGSWTVREDATQGGTVATVRFAVRIDAYTTR